MSKKKSAGQEWLEAIVIAVVLAMFIRVFFVQAFKIPSGSMRPTLLEGDRILVSKLVYGPKVPFIGLRLPGFRQPRRGDVTVFSYPLDVRRHFIKRLIGLGEEKIEISDGKVYIDGKPLDGPEFARRYYNYGNYGAEGQEIIIPEENYYVLGDNSLSSEDSRYWGFVAQDHIIGRAFLIYWPPQRIRIIK